MKINMNVCFFVAVWFPTQQKPVATRRRVFSRASEVFCNSFESLIDRTVSACCDWSAHLQFLTLFQSRTQSPRAFWPAGEHPERLWDNRLHFPRKRGFRSYDVWLSLNGSRKEKTVNSRNGGLKVFEKQEF